jgi:hypothetical protein
MGLSKRENAECVQRLCIIFFSALMIFLSME